LPKALISKTNPGNREIMMWLRLSKWLDWLDSRAVKALGDKSGFIISYGCYHFAAA
jgi:hypothetical protein